MQYQDFQFLKFDRLDNAVLQVTLNRPDVMNAINARLHWELAKVWAVIADDPATKVVVVTGAGERAFSAGGDLEWVSDTIRDPASFAETSAEVDEIIANMLSFEKPVISAINGAAVGAGLAVALMADISIMAEEAKISDGHVKIGVPAGDHAASIWLSRCGMAKAKYYLMTADFIGGQEAERIGLVSLCVPRAEVLQRAISIANNLAGGSQTAIGCTKRSLNKLFQDALPAFDPASAKALFSVIGDDAEEGVAAVREKRSPDFPSARIG